jgi:glycosyltransferase involved in cell wall biosynthesis
VIQHGIDLNQYPILDKRESRLSLGLSTDKPVLAAVLDQSAEGRKGEPLLETVLNSLDIPCVVATFGRGSLNVVNPAIELHNFDYLQQPEEVSHLLSAADLFVFPSLAEAFGQVVIEAMACGTPTLCYSIGGLPELIEPNVTGWLMSQPTANALTQNLSRILNSRSYLDMPKSCRRHAEHHFSRDRMISAYLTLFEDVLNEREHTTSTFSPTVLTRDD